MQRDRRFEARRLSRQRQARRSRANSREAEAPKNLRGLRVGRGAVRTSDRGGTHLASPTSTAKEREGVRGKGRGSTRGRLMHMLRRPHACLNARHGPPPPQCMPNSRPTLCHVTPRTQAHAQTRGRGWRTRARTRGGTNIPPSPSASAPPSAAPPPETTRPLTLPSSCVSIAAAQPSPAQLQRSARRRSELLRSTRGKLTRGEARACSGGGRPRQNAVRAARCVGSSCPRWRPIADEPRGWLPDGGGGSTPSVARFIKWLCVAWHVRHSLDARRDGRPRARLGGRRTGRWLREARP